jgi:hypothetical protein
MKILFLHGWQSVPGGLKPTYLIQHGHEVINPALDDDDFAEAVRTAQAEYDRHRPDVIVGSSRGGAVAMNIGSGSTPQVLLCPAWRRWGTATTVKPGTVILHSEADDVIPIADSRELVGASGLSESALIVVGTDHRLAEPEPLKAMLGACERAKATEMADQPIPVPRKRRKPLFTEIARDFEERLLGNLLPVIESSGHSFMAVGIDMAAQEDNWGFSIISINKTLNCGSLRLLLPHHFELDGFKKKHKIKPSSRVIAGLIEGLKKQSVRIAIAVDVPFGWPQEHSLFLQEWCAVPVPGYSASFPPRDCFEYRLCDREMRRLLESEGRSPVVLAVGADKIASAAFELPFRVLKGCLTGIYD